MTGEQKREVTAHVVRQEYLTGDILDLVLETPLAEEAKPGQFVDLYCPDSSRLLPRPISICDVYAGNVRLVYRTVGSGTREFALLKEGDTVRMVGNLGNGYDLNTAKGRHVMAVGGGLGIPPMKLLMKRLHSLEGDSRPASLTTVLGYRDSQSTFLDQEFDGYGKVILASDDGSVGIKGTVLDAIREAEKSRNERPEVIYACGPMIMLKAIGAYAEEKGIDAYISLEERMACGVGACLGCVVKTVRKDGHSQVNNARICTEGPVFAASEVML